MHPIEDDAAVALLRPLDGEPAAASTIDIERAMREGRRRRHRRTATRTAALVAATGLVIAGGAAAVTTLRGTASHPPDATNAAAPTASAASASARPPRTPPITTAPPAPPTRCPISLLPMPNGIRMGIVTGADPTGRIILGRAYLGDGDKQALLWRDGTLQKLPLVGGDPSLNDANTAGTAVGFEFGPGEEGQFPVVYRDGAVKRMESERGGEARGINEAGVIAGVIGQNRASAVPVRWAGPDARPERLPLPAGYSYGRAQDIDEDGTIVGYLGDQQTPYVWFADGEHRPLPLPTIDGKVPTGGDAMTIRNGWVIGMAALGLGDSWPVRWNVHTGETLVFPEFGVRASSVNAHGWQVGPGPTPGGLFRTATGTVALPGLPLGTDANALSVIPTTVSDDGRTIAGQSDDASNTLRAVVWRCS